MALTVMQIYKILPRTHCKDCGFPTCMAFAMEVAAKQKSLSDCPHLSEEAQAALSEASVPPMKLIKIGTEGKGIEIGQETVMFRHEEKFYRPCGIAVRIPSSLSEDEAMAKVDQINNSVFTRVGAPLKVQLCAVEIEECNDSSKRVQSIADRSNVPLILSGNSSGPMKTAVNSMKTERPLIYKATSSNIEEFAEIAVSAKLPLAVWGKDLEELADLTQKAKEKGVEEIILSFDGKNLGEIIRSLTITRRAALKKNFRPFGYPAMVELDSDSPEAETVFASMFAAKYAGIVLINGSDPWELLPIMTMIQDIYTDPQVPNAVEAKLYEIGSPDENSPVAFTTNFSLTYFSVAGEVERSKIPTYISVIDTEGLGVLNAYAGDKISAEKVVETLKEQKVAERVKHHKLVIPGLLSMFRAEIEDISEWKEVIIGPENAREIPAFLNKIWNK